MDALEKPGSHKENAFVNHTNLYHKGEEEEVKFKMELLNTYT